MTRIFKVLVTVNSLLNINVVKLRFEYNLIDDVYKHFYKATIERSIYVDLPVSCKIFESIVSLDKKDLNKGKNVCNLKTIFQALTLVSSN